MGFLAREKGIYAFGPFRLDPVRRILTRGRDSVKLTARLFDTLLYLVENHDRLVERDELQRAVWQGRTVDEANLGQAISTLRKVLVGTGAAETYIVTVAGRGYRFAEPVLLEPDQPPGLLEVPDTQGDAGAASQIQPRDQSASQPRVRWKPPGGALVAGLAIGLALGALGFVLWWPARLPRHQVEALAPSSAGDSDIARRDGAATIVAKSGASIPWTEGHRLQNGRLTFLFGSSSTGYTTANADRVDAISWIDSSGRAISNYIVQADRHCNDAIEFFGEAYGNGRDARPYALIHGETSTWSGHTETAGNTVATSNLGCSLSLDASTTSGYELFSSPGLINAMKVGRTLKFAASAAAGDMRAYVMRVPAASYPYVVYPDSTNTLHAVHVVLCSDNCVFTNWNGKWMADDTGTGQGIAIFRQPNAAFQTEITVDYDDDSASNASAITFIRPATGWSRKVIAETEYLCFYDATSWTPSERAVGLPPAGCTDVPH
jgi:DNA-binding winged helix-turn-helix (wHTH) protein